MGGERSDGRHGTDAPGPLAPFGPGADPNRDFDWLNLLI